MEYIMTDFVCEILLNLKSEVTALYYVNYTQVYYFLILHVLLPCVTCV